MLKNSDFNINCLYILEATVGDKLTTYFPIPVQNGNYSYIQGPTQVIYTSGGEPTYNKEPYKLLEGADNWSMEGITWELVISPTFRYIGPVEENNYNNNYYIKEGNNYIKSERWNASDFYYDSNTQETLTQYCGSLSEEYKLKPIPIYVEDAPVYGVQAKQGNTILWTQPILVLQNKWPNNVINKWDGESLVLNEGTSTILAAAIAAGKKNAEDNTFSGVMLGDWGNQDAEDAITKQTGVYGFHHGAMSYALKEDGTAFFGKDGKGRINIDGNEATIYSETYGSKSHGIKIDLNDPYIVLSNSYNKETIAKANTDTFPFQIGSNFKVEWNGTIHAINGNFKGKISTSTLQSGKGGIILDGYFNIPTISSDDTEYQAYFGALSANLPGVDEGTETAGIGISAGVTEEKNLGKVIASRANAGMSFGEGYITINADTDSNSGYDYQDYIHIDGGGLICDIPAKKQHGIYARFA